MKVRVLILSLGVLAAPQVLAQHALLGGNETNVDNIAGVCTILVAQIVPTPPGAIRYCIATGSSDAINPDEQGTHTYAFEPTLDNVVCDPIDGGAERTLEFNNVAANFEWDNEIKEITSTRFFEVIGNPQGQGPNVIRWTVEPQGNAPPLTVDDSSLTVVCSLPGDARLPYTPIPD